MSDVLGPTGEFPQGKLRPDDQGGLAFAVTNDRGKVLISFNTPVAWLGLDPQVAADFASLLVSHARAAALSTGVVVNFTFLGPARAKGEDGGGG